MADIILLGKNYHDREDFRNIVNFKLKIYNLKFTILLVAANAALRYYSEKTITTAKIF